MVKGEFYDKMKICFSLLDIDADGVIQA